jgi:hypothetical protein
MCQFCPEIVAYRVDADKNLIPIYEEGWDEDGEGDVAAAADAIEARMAKILAEHRGRLPDGLSGGPPVA